MCHINKKQILSSSSSDWEIKVQRDVVWYTGIMKLEIENISRLQNPCVPLPVHFCPL